MATTTIRETLGTPNVPTPTDAVIVAPIGPRPLSWGAILGGAVAALGVWAMLYAMGVAFGLSSIDPDDPGSVRGSSIFTGIWGLVTPLLALAVGGFVAGRTAGVTTRMHGALHGLVMWGVTTVAGAWLVASALGAIVGGIATMGSAAAQAGGNAVTAMASRADGDVVRSFGLDADDALQPVNERLRAEGKPTIKRSELEAATKDVVRDATREGRLDREMLITSIDENTKLSRTDAEEVAGRVETQFDEASSGARERISDAATAAQTKALEAADKTGKAFFGVFGALFLGMVSALIGAALGVSRRQRLLAGEEVPVDRKRPIDTRRDVPAT